MFMYDDFEPGFLNDVDMEEDIRHSQNYNSLSRPTEPALPQPKRYGAISPFEQPPTLDSWTPGKPSRATDLFLQQEAGIDFNEYLPPMEKESSAYRRFQEIAQQTPEYQKPGLARKLAAVALAGLGGYVNAGGRARVDTQSSTNALLGFDDYQRRLGEWKERVGAAARSADDERQRNMEMNQAENARTNAQRANVMLNNQRRQQALDLEKVRQADDALKIKQQTADLADRKAVQNREDADEFMLAFRRGEFPNLTQAEANDTYIGILTQGKAYKKVTMQRTGDPAMLEVNQWLTEAKVRLAEAQINLANARAGQVGKSGPGSGSPGKLDQRTREELANIRKDIDRTEKQESTLNAKLLATNKEFAKLKGKIDADGGAANSADRGAYESARQQIIYLSKTLEELREVKKQQYEHRDVVVNVQKQSGQPNKPASTGKQPNKPASTLTRSTFLPPE